MNNNNNKEQQQPVDNAADVNSPSPETPVPPNPILNEKAAEYLREPGNIEDVPNASEQEEVDKAINDNNRQ